MPTISPVQILAIDVKQNLDSASPVSIMSAHERDSFSRALDAASHFGIHSQTDSSISRSSQPTSVSPQTVHLNKLILSGFFIGDKVNALNSPSNSWPMLDHVINLLGSAGANHPLTQFNLAQELLQTGAIQEGQSVLNHTLRGVTSLLDQRGGVLTLRLEPPELGQLHIQMSITRDVVAAEIMATTPQAQTLLEHNLVNLRFALEHLGLAVDRLHVVLNTPGHQTMSENPNDNLNHPSDSRHDAGDGRSRGRQDNQMNSVQQTDVYDENERADKNSAQPSLNALLARMVQLHT